MKSKLIQIGMVFSFSAFIPGLASAFHQDPPKGILPSSSSVCLAHNTGAICTITGEGVRLRSTPSKASNNNVIGSFKKGEQVYYIKSHDVYDNYGNFVESWYLVEIPRSGKQGWVYSDYCECYDLN